jgi:UDP-glucose 4-epimerase
MTWLITGGAGYLGSHTVPRLLDAGHRLVVYDDLSTGFAQRLPAGVPLVVGSTLDATTLTETLHGYRVTGVVHLAAHKSVPDSILRPGYYHHENVDGLRTLLRAMNTTGVRRLVFASSAAVYGTPPTAVVTEHTPPRPLNPYGHTKLQGERLVRAAGRTHRMSWLALRYFNIAGADSAATADRGTSLVPRLLRALARGEPLTIAGTDYPTRDGTALRDYIHVADVADAHIAAVNALTDRTIGAVLNVGSGIGHTVREVIDCAQRTTARPVPHHDGPRRTGDPAEIIADPTAIATTLGWTARRTLTDTIASAWLAHDRPADPPPAQTQNGVAYRRRRPITSNTPATAQSGAAAQTT